MRFNHTNDMYEFKCSFSLRIIILKKMGFYVVYQQHIIHKMGSCGISVGNYFEFQWPYFSFQKWQKYVSDLISNATYDVCTNVMTNNGMNLYWGNSLTNGIQRPLFDYNRRWPFVLLFLFSSSNDHEKIQRYSPLVLPCKLT